MEAALRRSQDQFLRQKIERFFWRDFSGEALGLAAQSLIESPVRGYRDSLLETAQETLTIACICVHS